MDTCNAFTLNSFLFYHFHFACATILRATEIAFKTILYRLVSRGLLARLVVFFLFLRFSYYGSSFLTHTACSKPARGAVAPQHNGMSHPSVSMHFLPPSHVWKAWWWRVPACTAFVEISCSHVVKVFAVCNKLRAALVCSGGATTTTHSLSVRVSSASAVVFSFHSCHCHGHHGCRVITSLHTHVVHFTHLAKKKKNLVASLPFGPFFFPFCVAASFSCCLFRVDFGNGCIEPLAMAKMNEKSRVCVGYGSFFLPHTCLEAGLDRDISLWLPAQDGCCSVWHS